MELDGACMNNQSCFSDQVKPMVAVVLSTYNGGKYVVEQLDSLLKQTRIPDRIMICDDCSDDDTVSILQEYIANHSNGQITFYLSVNEANNGWRANFRKLIVNSDADYIFPCDQDDIWKPEKIERMVKIMESNTSLDVLACSVDPFYECGSQKSDAESTERGDGLEPLEIKKLTPDFMFIRHPGCSYCVRKGFVQRIEPYWEADYPHDATLWRYAILDGGAAVLNERLVAFRRHEHNASVRRKQTLDERIADVDYYIDFIEHAKCFVEQETRIDDEAREILDSCDEWLDARKAFLKTGRLAAAVRCLRNRRFYKSSRGLVLDCAFSWIKGLKL